MGPIGPVGPRGPAGPPGPYVVSAELFYDAGGRVNGMVSSMSDGSTRTMRVVRDAMGKPSRVETES